MLLWLLFMHTFEQLRVHLQFNNPLADRNSCLSNFYFVLHGLICDVVMVAIHAPPSLLRRIHSSCQNTLYLAKVPVCLLT